MTDYHDIPDDEQPPKSKSAIKREMTALQKIGEQLVDLSASQLAKTPMPEELQDAVELAQRLKHREGRRRQLQYIGKLMRNIDTDEIVEKLAFFNQEGELYRQHFHQLERWRDRLLAEGDAVLNELVQQHPILDRQHLRQLIRLAQKEAQQSKAPATARKLFKYLRESLTED